ncbi:glycosyltransferase family 25 protein [Sulfitobacter sp. JB4-11]|uniref:glycosyltransferase family 25 protein n=1 Tax=Sulfitobacter rhodophyticola TaxID=3238304 RepID=UPI003516C601
MQSLIIHMTGAQARAGNVATLLDTLPDARIIPAVDGRNKALEYPTAPGTLHRPHYPFPLRSGERGCFLSHRRCWEEIAASNDPYALVVEDDLHLDPILWHDTLRLIERNATADSFIRLPAKNREPVTTVQDTEGASKLFIPRVIGLQTVAQVVGRSAARRLLDTTETIDRPVDTVLQMHWVTGQPIQTILPNGVSELPGPSTIQKKTRTSGKLMREIRRAVYRMRVARRPQP